MLEGLGTAFGGPGQLTDENLADSPACSKTKDVFPHGRVPPHEVECSSQLAGTARDVHAQPLTDARRDQPGAQQQVQPRHHGHHHVVGAHHLRAGVGPEGLEDVVLGAVGQAVKQQIDAQEQQAPGGVGIVRPRRLPLLLARVQREDGDAGRHRRHDQVLVERVALAEYRDVQEHDGQQLAALGEQEGDVVGVGEAGVAEGARQAAGDGDEGQRREEAARGDDWRDLGPFRRRGNEVDAADGGCEGRLHRVQEDGEVPDFARTLGSVGRRGQLLLKVGPCQAATRARQWSALARGCNAADDRAETERSKRLTRKHRYQPRPQQAAPVQPQTHPCHHSRP